LDVALFLKLLNCGCSFKVGGDVEDGRGREFRIDDCFALRERTRERVPSSRDIFSNRGEALIARAGGLRIGDPGRGAGRQRKYEREDKFLANGRDMNFPEKASRIFPAVRRLRHSPLVVCGGISFIWRSIAGILE